MYIFLLTQGHMRRRNVFSTGSFYIYIHRYALNNNQSRIVLSKTNIKKSKYVNNSSQYLHMLFISHYPTSGLFLSLLLLRVISVL